jgi:hypothetical protein
MLIKKIARVPLILARARQSRDPPLIWCDMRWRTVACQVRVGRSATSRAPSLLVSTRSLTPKTEAGATGTGVEE